MTTSVSDLVVEKQAKDYEGTRDDLNRQLEQARSHAHDLVSRSRSEATKALNEIIDSWVNNTQKQMLQHMTQMATDIRNAKNAQFQADQDSNKQILNLPPVTSAFLGG